MEKCGHDNDQAQVSEKLKHDLWSKLSSSPFVMIGLEGGHAEPLMVQLDRDAHNVLYFFVGKTNRMARGGNARATFMAKGHDFYASLLGNASISADQGMVDKLWNNNVEAWFPGGKADAALLRFDITDAEMWENDIGLTNRVKMAFGGKIHCPHEAGSHAHVKDTAEHSGAK
jgi:general stress protein 26